jgi:hypothetical protein
VLEVHHVRPQAFDERADLKAQQSWRRAHPAEPVKGRRDPQQFVTAAAKGAKPAVVAEPGRLRSRDECRFDPLDGLQLFEERVRRTFAATGGDVGMAVCDNETFTAPLAKAASSRTEAQRALKRRH